MKYNLAFLIIKKISIFVAFFVNEYRSQRNYSATFMYLFKPSNWVTQL